MSGYKTTTQEKNIAWFLPRPKKDRYKGGMPLHCEKWLLELAADILGMQFEEMQILTLFAGMSEYGFRVDLKEDVNPDLCTNIEWLYRSKDKLPTTNFDVVIADPPYSAEENKELYGIELLTRYARWSKQVDEVLRPGGLFIIYHKYVMPNPNPEVYHVEKRVFVGNRTYHVPRVAIYFQKNPDTCACGNELSKQDKDTGEDVCDECR